MVSRSEAYKAASGKKPDSSDILCDFCREYGSGTSIDQRGNTILHFLAIHGNAPAIKKLDNHGLLTAEQLKQCNANGDTALHEAARFGHKGVAEMILVKEGNLILARNEFGETPIHLAAAFGKNDVFDFLNDFLKTKVSDEWWMRMRTEDGCTILHAAVNGEYYGLAMSILESYPGLAGKRDEKGSTALNLLASKPSSFRSGSPYTLKNLGFEPSIPWQILGVLVYICIPFMLIHSKTAGDEEDPCCICKSEGTLLSKLVSGYRKIIRACAWIKPIDDAKQKHGYAIELAKRLIEVENGWKDNINFENLHVSGGVDCFGDETPLSKNKNKKNKNQNQNQKKNRVVDPLIQATKHRIHEMVEEIIKKFPNVATTVDENGRNILHIAALLKDVVLYDNLKNTVNHADRMMADVDNDGNSILHLAAKIYKYKSKSKSKSKHDYFPRNVFGPTNQMSWDVFWFKRIQNDLHPHLIHHQNSDGKTAKKVFHENHIKLTKQAEKTAKEINGGLMLISALIGTVNYAALFTIPGGFSSSDGLPIFFTKATSGRHDLQLFMFYVGGSLVASLLGLGTQFSIQLSRFSSDDFYISLPLKFVFATTALFYATAFSVTTCFQIFIIEDAFINSYFGAMWFACILMNLVYIDALYLTYNYLYYIIRYSLAYKSQKM